MKFLTMTAIFIVMLTAIGCPFDDDDDNDKKERKGVFYFKRLLYQTYHQEVFVLSLIHRLYYQEYHENELQAVQLLQQEGYLHRLTLWLLPLEIRY